MKDKKLDTAQRKILISISPASVTEKRLRFSILQTQQFTFLWVLIKYTFLLVSFSYTFFFISFCHFSFFFPVDSKDNRENKTKKNGGKSFFFFIHAKTNFFNKIIDKERRL